MPQVNTAQIRSGQTRVFKCGSSEVSATEVSLAKICASEIRATCFGVCEYCTLQICCFKTAPVEQCFAEIRELTDRRLQLYRTTVHLAEVRIAEVNAWQSSAAEVSST